MILIIVIAVWAVLVIVGAITEQTHHTRAK
jgi:hypothetical protein